MTTSEYLQTPETVLPQELAFGVLRVADSPIVRHQRVVRDLTIALTAFVDDNRLGEVLPAPMDVILDRERDLIVQPDVLFVSRDREQIVDDRIHGAPDLVIEVLSPRPRIGELDERVEWFARYGVRECWLIHIVRREMVVLTFEAGRVATRTLAAPDAPIPSVVLAGFPASPVALFGWPWRH